MDLLAINFHHFMEVALSLMSSPGVIVSVVIGVLGCYFYGPYWAVRKVPGPSTMPFIGHLHLFAKHGPDVFSILANRYGPIFRFHMGRQPLVIVADPELCREVGITKFKVMQNRSVPSPIASAPLHQKGLFFTSNPRWSIMRNAVVSVYQPSQLATLIPTMQDFIQSSTQNLESYQDFNFSDFSIKLGTDIIGQAAFGVDFGISKPEFAHVNSFEKMNVKHEDAHVQKFIQEHIHSTTQLKMDLTGSFSVILGLLVPILQEPFRQILKRIPGTMDCKFEQHSHSLSNRVNEIVKTRMKEMDGNSKDFVTLILKAIDKEASAKHAFSPDYISGVTYEHLLAGSTTTAFTLSSIIYLVACHPNVEKKLLEEIDGFGSHDQMPDAHDLKHKFPYIDQVIKEAMRFYLVSPLIARETLAQVEIGGYVLPKGSWVWMAPGVLAKDPKNFPEPEKFKPERFDPNRDEEKQRHPYAHIPFGLGPRTCIGQKFSLQEIKLSMIHLYRKYIFRHSPNMENPPELDYGLILSFRHGVKVQAIKRE